MIINKIKLNDIEILTYDNEEFPKDLLKENSPIELLEENIDLIERTDLHQLPIFDFANFLLMMNPYIKSKKTNDHKLSEIGVNSFYDLQNAYNLVRNKLSHFSKSQRDMIVDKYSLLVNN